MTALTGVKKGFKMDDIFGDEEEVVEEIDTLEEIGAGLEEIESSDDGDSIFSDEEDDIFGDDEEPEEVVEEVVEEEVVEEEAEEGTPEEEVAEEEVEEEVEEEEDLFEDEPTEEEVVEVKPSKSPSEMETFACLVLDDQQTNGIIEHFVQNHKPVVKPDPEKFLNKDGTLNVEYAQKMIEEATNQNAEQKALEEYASKLQMSFKVEIIKPSRGEFKGKIKETKISFTIK